MANALKDIVWIIDTAGPDLITTETVEVDGLRWNAAAAGNVLEIKNGNGDVIFRHVADVDWLSVESLVPFRLLKGFAVSTMTAGTLRLYLETD